MKLNYITSRSNDKIKYIMKLVSSKRLRDAERLFVLDGLRLCLDAVRSGYAVKEAFVTEELLNKHSDEIEAALENVKSVYVISEEISEKISDTVSPQGIYFVCEAREEKTPEIKKGERYICLENVQNPQNLGAVSRTAEALGISAIIVLSGCDIYNPKALRASMGSLLRIPVYKMDSAEQVLTAAKQVGVPSFATVPDAGARDIRTVDFSLGALAVIGNEANGVSEQVKGQSDMLVTVKMKGEAESLNASAAADIVMWEMMR